MCENGWEMTGAGRVQPQVAFIDSGYQTDVVYQFVREHGGRYWPIKGYGSDPRLRGYSSPKGISSTVKFIGDNYHISLLPEGVYLVEINVDFWKLFLHKRLTTPVGQPGAMTLHQGDKHTHTEFAKHCVAEKLVDEFVPGKGIVQKWIRQQKANHFFDAAAYCCPAAHKLGVRLISDQPTAKTKPTSKPAEETDRSFVRQSSRRGDDDESRGWIRRRSK